MNRNASHFQSPPRTSSSELVGAAEAVQHCTYIDFELRISSNQAQKGRPEIKYKKMKYQISMNEEIALASRSQDREGRAKTHSVSANLKPMHARFPLVGFPFKKVKVFDQRPGMALVSGRRFSQRSGLSNAPGFRRVDCNTMICESKIKSRARTRGVEGRIVSDMRTQEKGMLT